MDPAATRRLRSETSGCGDDGQADYWVDPNSQGISKNFPSDKTRDEVAANGERRVTAGEINFASVAPKLRGATAQFILGQCAPCRMKMLVSAAEIAQCGGRAAYKRAGRHSSVWDANRPLPLDRPGDVENLVRHQRR
jgi:hypothetical protein